MDSEGGIQHPEAETANDHDLGGSERQTGCDMAYVVSHEPPCSTPSAEPHQSVRIRAQNPATPGDSTAEDKPESPFAFKNDIDCTSIPLVRAAVK
jgi:hypothetical protein